MCAESEIETVFQSIHLLSFVMSLRQAASGCSGSIGGPQKNDQGIGTPLLQRQAEEAGVVQPG